MANKAAKRFSLGEILQRVDLELQRQERQREREAKQHEAAMERISSGLPLITPFMALSTENGDIEIREQDLSSIAAAQLKGCRITRKQLRRCFAEAMEMMRDATQEDWAKGRPTAVQALNGTWEVHGPLGHSQYSPPMMQGPASEVTPATSSSSTANLVSSTGTTSPVQERSAHI